VNPWGGCSGPPIRSPHQKLHQKVLPRDRFPCCETETKLRRTKMAPYDGDSSSDEDVDLTETDVLLGYADKESSGETISRLGGQPVCLVQLHIKTCLTRCRNGWRNPRRLVPLSRDAKYAVTPWYSSSSSTANSQVDSPAMTEGYTSFPAGGRHVDGGKGVFAP